MCKQLLPIDELENIKWAVWAVAQLAALDDRPGNYAQENRANAVRGIQLRLDWIIRNLKAAGEGKKVGEPE
jgi:hypothetical protein